MRSMPGWKTCTLLIVVALHAWVGWSLANFKPDGRLSPTRIERDLRNREVVTVLTFESRPEPARAKTPKRRAAHSRRRPLDFVPGPVSDAAAASGVPGSGTAAPLRLHVAPPKLEFARPDPLAHRAAGLENTTTRFDRAWLSQGNLTDVAARRSKVASVVLGALGALRKPCTGRQRRDYEADCVPAQYRYQAGDED
jgi:hypothetical protein